MTTLKRIAHVPVEIHSNAELTNLTKSYGSVEEIATARLYEQAAIERFYKESGVTIGAATFEGYTEKFTDTVIHVAPFSTIAITYKDINGVDQTLATSNYDVLKNGDDVVKLVFKDDLPELQEDNVKAVKYTVTGGYAVNEVPALIKSAIWQSIIYWFDNPAESRRSYPSTFDYVIDIYRRTWL